MLTQTVDVNKVEMNLKELLSLVSEGTEIVLTENNIPRARLGEIAPQTGPLIAGISGQLMLRDRPLTDELWTGGAWYILFMMQWIAICTTGDRKRCKMGDITLISCHLDDSI